MGLYGEAAAMLTAAMAATTNGTYDDTAADRKAYWMVADSLIVFVDVVVIVLSVLLCIVVCSKLGKTIFHSIKFFVILFIVLGNLASIFSHILKLAIFDYEYGWRFAIEFEFLANILYLTCIGLVLQYWIRLFNLKYSGIGAKWTRYIFYITSICLGLVALVGFIIMFAFILPTGTTRYAFSCVLSMFCCLVAMVYALCVLVVGILLCKCMAKVAKENEAKRSPTMCKLGVFTGLLVAILFFQSILQFLSALIFGWDDMRSALKDFNPFLYGIAYILLQNVPELVIVLFFSIDPGRTKKEKEVMDTILDSALDDMSSQRDSAVFGTREDADAVFAKL